MKKFFVLPFLLMLCILMQAGAQDSTWSSYFPQTPKAGEPLKIVYHPGKKAAGSAAIKGIIYLFDTAYRWHADDLPLQPAGDSFTAVYTLPTDAALAAWKFKINGTEDRGSKFPYTVMMTSPQGGLMPGAYFAWGTMRAPYFQRISPPVADSASYIAPEVVRMWIRNEMARYPDKRLLSIVPSFTAFRMVDTSAAATATMYSELKKVTSNPNLSEKNWMDVATIYRTVLKNWPGADSVDNLIVQQFPKGIVARDRRIYKIFRIKDAGQKSKEIEQLLQDYPPAQFTDVHTESTDLYYGKLFQNLVYTPVMKDSNYAYFFTYLPVVPDNMLSTFYHHLVEIPYQQQQVAAATLMRLSDSLINRIATSQPEGLLSPAERQAAFISINTTPFFTHAKLLRDFGQTEKALHYANLIRESLAYKNAAFNDLYIQLLAANNQQAAIPAYLKNSIAVNAATPAMLSLFEADYRKAHGSLEGYEAYLNTTKGSTRNLQQKELAEELIDQPIYPFRLLSAKGNYVDLKKLKGKVVILDFWATWCAPCKAAMPGMQLAVEKYKKDTNVVFFFISTLEIKPDYKQLTRKFIEEKQYPFEVLYDGYNAATKHPDAIYSRYAADFHFSGIPQKMIIDANGRLRWRSTGFFGSPSALADEISTVVELVKKS